MDANGHEIINAKLQSMKIVRPPMNDEIATQHEITYTVPSEDFDNS